MNVFRSLNNAVCVAALLTGTSAMADVTAAQVWEDWKKNLDLYGSEGFSVGAETAGEGTLTVSDIVLSMSDDTSTVDAKLGDLVFTELGDGTVSVTTAESYPISIVDAGTELDMTVFNTGLSIIVSGDPGALNYAISADSYGVTVTPTDEMTGDIRLTANGITGNYSANEQDALRVIGYQLNAASVDVLVDVKSEADQTYMVFSGKIDALNTSFGADVPADFDPEAPENMFVNGFAFEGGYDFSGANYIFDFDIESEQAAGTLSMGAGSLSAQMAKSSVSYLANTKDLNLQFQAKALPFPVTFTAAEYGIGVNVPLATSDEPSDFGASVRLIDLTINDEIWAMVDPGTQIPRDPATMDVAVSGTGKLFFDLLDPTQSDAIAQADVPGELNSINLDSLKLAIAGAVLTGNGGFTFDNTDLETFAGFPRPMGEVNVEMTGANALIDTLVSMGLLPEDQATMGRMMMGMFARSTGDDQLSSKLEINAEGHVLANGQRLQ